MTATFAPPDLSGLHAWWDAQQETFNDGDAVGTFTDRSATPHNLTQATAGNKPLFKKGANGITCRNAILFDGVDDYLTTALNAYTPISVFTMCCVIRTGASVTGTFNILDAVNSAVTGQTALGVINGLAYMQGTSFTSSTPTPIAANTNYRLVFIYNGASSFILINTVSTGALSPGAANIASYRMGADNSPAGFFNGLVGEVMVYSRVLTAGELTTVDRYLQLRWGFDRRQRVKLAGVLQNKPIMVKDGSGNWTERPVITPQNRSGIVVPGRKILIPRRRGDQHDHRSAPDRRILT